MSVYCVYIKLCASVGVLRNYARLEHKGQGQEEQEMARASTNKKVLEGGSIANQRKSGIKGRRIYFRD